MDSTKYKRYNIKVTGIVQGVGFRPFIYTLAKTYKITGKVLNDSEGVEIEAQGKQNNVENFIKNIKLQVPKAAIVLEVRYREISIINNEHDFIIDSSKKLENKDTLISPDLAICADCKNELANRDDRRYLYPFINCTNCGPRFTIIEDIPYDRNQTTMKNFPMCDNCHEEYVDPMNRRFHAQPNACEICGPSYTLLSKEEKLTGNIAVKKAKQLLRDGKIIAIKGIGGFHLACDAKNESSVNRLRSKKKREDKPFAVMCYSVKNAKNIVEINEKEEELLTSVSAPIVLLKKATNYNLAYSVAPNNPNCGIMMPYAPIHYLICDDDFALVMTSANLSNEPIIYKNEDAKEYLFDIADYLLIHNRDIKTRVDDSVMRIIKNKKVFLRRSRGFVPAPLLLEKEFPSSILATGGELKSTFALTKKRKIFISQHLGDLIHLPNFDSYLESLDLFKKMFDINPQIVACDMHPEYISSKFAHDLKLPCIEIQHHHAHIASVMAEHNLDEDIIGISLDGTGFGCDKTIWGGEFLIVNPRTFKRWGHFSYRPLPGSDKAIKEPWRLALWQAAQIYGKSKLEEKYPKLIKDNWKLVLQIADNKINSPITSSAGRVFDTASALLGICEYINYEGQAAIEMEHLATGNSGRILSYDIFKQDKMHILDMKKCFEDLYEVNKIKGVGYAAYSFHLTMAHAIVNMILKMVKETNLKKIAFSGGVCQNKLLMDLIFQILPRNVQIFINEKVPANDGGLSLGQAYIASKILEKKL